jgi:uncharacterized protein (TIGR01319 family)
LAVQATQAELLAPAVNSILSADFGSVNTRVVLLDLVGGRFRLLARTQTFTTADPPLVDVSIGLRRAVAEMSTLIDRPLLRGEELATSKQFEGGIDVFLATASGGRPMKTVLVGLMPDVSVASGRRALTTTYVEVTETLSLADIRTAEQQVNAILRSQPDLIFIVGGTDYGANEAVVSLLKLVQLAVLLIRGQKPVVLYAGNEALRPVVNDLLGPEVSLYMASNVRPGLHDERLGPAQLELALAYGTYKSATIGGYEEVQRTSQLGVVPTAQSYSNILRYLGELPGAGLGVLLVDVGSATTTVCASIRKQSHVSIRPDLGLGHSAVNGVKTVGTRNIQRWLTFNATETDILDYAWNKALHPSTVPQTSRDLEFEYAIARELIRNAVAATRSGWRGVPRGDVLPQMRPIIGAGSVLAQAVDPGIGALLLLDSLQPVGVSELRLDPYGVIAALGAIAYVEPLAVVHVLESGGLLNLGTAISPSGRPGGSTAMDVTVRYADGQTARHQVASGTLQLVSLPTGQKAQVAIKLGRGLTINGMGRVALTVEGGVAGLILDGRGRPIPVPREIERRAEVIPKWYEAVLRSGG